VGWGGGNSSNKEMIEKGVSRERESQIRPDCIGTSIIQRDAEYIFILYIEYSEGEEEYIRNIRE
jgi:hypothetical protein